MRTTEFMNEEEVNRWVEEGGGHGGEYQFGLYTLCVYVCVCVALLDSVLDATF